MQRRQRRTTTQKALRAVDNTAKAQLVVLDGPGRGRKFKIRDDAVIGRSVVADVIIDHAEISRRHARIFVSDDGRFMVDDLGSSNGTKINGVPVAGETPLNIGDKIQLAGAVVLVLAPYDTTEEEILQRQRLETLGRLAAGLAHDFNNMQAVITAGMDYLRSLDPHKPLDDPRVIETLSDVATASERASDLARSLMSYARSDADGYVSVDVSQVCAEVLKFTERTFERSIRVRADISLDLHVIGNSAELHQLLMNLCVNARDALPNGGEMSVVAERITRRAPVDFELPSGDAHVLITVTDDGVGMDEETRARIFEPFFTTKSARAGFGLGLATVKQIVGSHGGTMDVRSTPGHGTTFRVCLPAAASPQARRAKSMAPGESAALPKLPAGTSVLVADDQEMVRRTMQRILEEAGCRVTLASDGMQVLARYAEQPSRPDLVILDLDMPTSTGDEAMDLLRDLDPQVRILVVSGHLEDERERAARANGAVGFLKKPFSASVLVTAVLGALHADIEIEEEKTTHGKPK